MPHALCVYLPKWPIQRLQIKHRDKQPKQQATLLVYAKRGQHLIASCCTNAEGFGVREGMTLAHARSLLHGQPADILNFSPKEDQQALKGLALWATRFSPIVADEADGLLMNIAGCEHLYGGERVLAQRVDQSMTRLGLNQRIAIAPTFSVARMTARYSSEPVVILREETMLERIADFPVEALRIEPSVCESLYAVGVERIAQLLALSREELAARYDYELLRRIDQTLGTAAELICPIREPESFLVTYVFDGPVLNIAAIETTAKQLLLTLTCKLKAASVGVGRLLVELLRIDASPQQVEWSFTCPTNDHEHIWTLIRPKLEQVNLGFGVEVLRLHATQTMRVHATQTFLWQESNWPVNNAAVGSLVDRLVEHLGPGAVHYPMSVDSYVPEQAFTFIGVHEPRRESLTNTARYSVDRPSRLYDIPEPAQVIALAPDGPPVQIQWRGVTLSVIASLGPERITGRWWMRSQQDEHSPIEVRDYFAVQDEHGRWLWLFRLASSNQWFVHGEWA